MGISMHTAVEIFTNPYDLEIDIMLVQDNGKFCFSITRGPGHNHKLLVSSRSFSNTRDDVIRVVEGILQDSYVSTTQELRDSGGHISQYLNPHGQEIDQSKVLNSDLITRILDELRRHGRVRTYNLVAVQS